MPFEKWIFRNDHFVYGSVLHRRLKTRATYPCPIIIFLSVAELCLDTNPKITANAWVVKCESICTWSRDVSQVHLTIYESLLNVHIPYFLKVFDVVYLRCITLNFHSLCFKMSKVNDDKEPESSFIVLRVVWIVHYSTSL